MANAKAHHERSTLVGMWLSARHVIALPIENGVIRLQIEDEIFYDRAEKFPTPELVARLTLAINAGRSHRKELGRIEDFNPNAPLSFSGPTISNLAWTAQWAEAMEQAYANVARQTKPITGAVTP